MQCVGVGVYCVGNGRYPIQRTPFTWHVTVDYNFLLHFSHCHGSVSKDWNSKILYYIAINYLFIQETRLSYLQGLKINKIFLEYSVESFPFRNYIPPNFWPPRRAPLIIVKKTRTWNIVLLSLYSVFHALSWWCHLKNIY